MPPKAVHQTVLTAAATPPDRPLRGVFDAPPLFTMGPNPGIAEFLGTNPRPPKRVEAFDADIRTGKNTYVYDAHCYHTKVPPEGIVQLIEHYTHPGDVVLDFFSGSGMTGVAASMTGRRCVLVDLSPAANFIAFNNLTPANPPAYKAAVDHLLSEGRELELALYGVEAPGGWVPAEYFVWSSVVECAGCHAEFPLFPAAKSIGARVKDSKIRTEFPCPACGAQQSKRRLARRRMELCEVGYKTAPKQRQEHRRPVTSEEVRRFLDIEARGIPAPLWFPTTRLWEGYNTRQPIAAGLDSVDKFYTTRNLYAMAWLWDRANRWPDPDVRMKLLYTLTSLYKRVTKFSEFRFWGGSGNTPNFYVPHVANEQNVFRAFWYKAETIRRYFDDARPRLASREFRVSTQSATRLDNVPDASIDYVFVDPPFGGNINYSEMNVLWEAWLGASTERQYDAVINAFQGKDVHAYEELLTAAFREAARVLRPDAWMTVMFSSAKKDVWAALQNGVRNAGFEVARMTSFDKVHGTFKEHVSEDAAGYHLLLHCRANQRPTPGEEVLTSAEDFVRSRLSSETKERYVTRFLHVSRGAEVNYRRLYAEWLCAVAPRSAVPMDFERFRAAAKAAVGEMAFMAALEGTG